MSRKESFTFRGPLAAVLLLSAALSACGSASGGSRAAFREGFRDVEINRIGDLRQSDVEFQNIAMRNAVRHAEGHQVPAEAVERITIVGNEPVAPSLSNSKFGGLNRRTSYRLWVKVVGCDRDILYTASPAGRLTSVTDEGRCLAARRSGPESESLKSDGPEPAPGDGKLSF